MSTRPNGQLGPTVGRDQRFTESNTCPICGGYESQPRGEGIRCYGFLSEGGEYAHCTREESSGQLPVIETSNTYAHRAQGECGCGDRHDMQDAATEGPPNYSGRISAAYTYDDENWRLVFQVVRFDPKGFACRRPDENREWVWDIKGVVPVLYRLPNLLQANFDDEVFIVEGEKDVERLESEHIVATCSPLGAGQWDDRYAACLEKRNVVVIADNDDIGRRHAKTVASSVRKVAKNVRLVELPGVPEGGDVSDYLERGNTIDDLLKLVQETPEWEAKDEPRVLRFRTAEEFCQSVSAEVLFIVEPYVVAGAITEISGKIKHAGKTTFTMAMARAVVDGTPFLGYPTTKTPVVYLTEQPDASFRQAIARAGLDYRRDFLLLSYKDAFAEDWETIIEAAHKKCMEIGSTLLIVDTLPQFAGMTEGQENDSGAAMVALKPLQKLTSDEIAVVAVRHDRKAGGEVGDSSRGSSAWGGGADTLATISKAVGNSASTVRILSCISRFDGPPDKLVIDLREGEYINLGNGTEVALSQAKEDIWKIIPDTEDEAKATGVILTATKTAKTVGQEALTELVGEGNLQRKVGQGKGSPWLYWKAQSTSSEEPA